MKITVFHNGERGRCVIRALKDHMVSTVSDEDVNDPKFVERQKKQKPDLFIVAGYSQIFKKPLLDVPRLGVWNCHAGPVPEYRGGSPLNWQIIDGKDRLTVSVLLMDEGLDAGPVLTTASIAFPKTGTIKMAHTWANAAFTAMISELLKADDVIPMPQPDVKYSHPQRNDNMGQLDPSWNLERQHDFIRALSHPYPGAWIEKDGQRMRIWSTSLD